MQVLNVVASGDPHVANHMGKGESRKPRCTVVMAHGHVQTVIQEHRLCEMPTQPSIGICVSVAALVVDVDHYMVGVLLTKLVHCL